MKEIIGFLSKLFSLISQVFLFIWKIVKFIFAKIYKFILAIISALIGLFIIRKTTDKE